MAKVLSSLLMRLNGPAADAALAGNLQHACTGAQLSLYALFERGIDPRPTELLALRNRALKRLQSLAACE